MSHCSAVPTRPFDYVGYGASVSRPHSGPPEPFPPTGSSRTGDSGAAGPAPRRPRAVALIAAITAVEATALLAAAAWYGIELLSGAPVTSLGGAVFTLGLLLAFSAWLYAVSLYLFRGYRWTRAAALVAQILVLTIGFPTMTGGYIALGLVMVIPAAAAIVLLFDKRVITFASKTGGAPPVL